MLKAFLPAAAVSLLLAASSASAGVPASTLTGTTAQDATGVVHQAQHRHRGHKHRYRAGGRYSRAPRGWRRYGARPYDWRTRGCIVVGPVWFCP
jgi:hypothetical protein